MTATALEKPVDDRLIRESGTDAKIAAIIAPVLVTIGFRLVRVRLTSQNGLTLQIMAERDDGTMTVEDCEEVSRAISPVLDVEDPVDKAYHLEISSPGIDRPLVRKSDFVAGIGHLAKIETSILVDNRKRFRGKIAEVSDEAVLIEPDRPAEGEAPAARVPFQAIAEARLVLTDDLIRAALRQDKKIRQERKKRRGAKAAADPETGSEQTGSEQTETEKTEQDN
jgi:ribosome maturation factor RimP